ncbi:MAG TPA: hypothetical protein VHL31_01410 [Geminicoccus sp.]|jgi:hypothetical protein|uniref:hypothetical protein n=1 Tax=Geminicoccus sp. TaxID=2024832 RepID=UPI002E3379A2|nr:hypothetical protein [Geminicoccus sp.]HEX2524943.1 hypothetical protein [Geminicoccus sp.]
MAYSDLDLCSQALVRLGAQPIGSFSAGSAEATVAQQLYYLVRDGLVSAHPWTFSIAQASLSHPDEADSQDFAWRHRLPSDCLRVISAGPFRSGRGLDYRVQGSFLLADQATITLTYQRRVPEAEYPAFFASALVTRLAAEFCLPVTESASRAELLRKSAEIELRQARLVDSQQSTPRRMEDFTLIEARLG